jgi:hypothetical protein
MHSVRHSQSNSDTRSINLNAGDPPAPEPSSEAPSSAGGADGSRKSPRFTATFRSHKNQEGPFRVIAGLAVLSVVAVFLSVLSIRIESLAIYLVAVILAVASAVILTFLYVPADEACAHCGRRAREPLKYCGRCFPRQWSEIEARLFGIANDASREGHIGTANVIRIRASRVRWGDEQPQDAARELLKRADEQSSDGASRQRASFLARAAGVVAEVCRREVAQ